MKLNVTQIEDGYICLTKDKNLTPKAVERGSIVIEDEVANLPEVQRLGRKDCVWDIGAFIGDTAMIFANLGCTVHAFEAQPDAFFCLRHNAFVYNEKAINAGYIYPYQAIVGNGNTVKVNQDPMKGNLGTRTVSPSNESEIKSVELDKWFESGIIELPTFVKIDCEGSEPMVIEGMKETLRIYKPMLLVEVYRTLLERNGFTQDDIYKPLVDIGYNQSRVAIGDDKEDRFDMLFWKE